MEINELLNCKCSVGTYNLVNCFDTNEIIKTRCQNSRK